MDEEASVEADVFEPVDIDRVADAVVEQVEELILTGALQPGQKLPPERDLSEMLDVSRPKLREAIQDLAARGLVEIRRSDGAYIAPLTGAPLAPPIAALYRRHPAAFFDTVEFRREQEAFAAHLAAQRATEADHETLRTLLRAMEDAHRAGEERREAELDVQFHLGVIAAAHNTLLLHVMRSIYDLITSGVFYSRNFLYQNTATRQRLLEQHKEIADAIISGDPDASAAASDRHLEFVERSFRLSEDEKRRARVARKRMKLFTPLTLPGARRRR